MVDVRPWGPRDVPAISGLQTGFASDVIYHVVDVGWCLCLREATLDVPVTKSYPISAPESPDSAFVAEVGGQVVGYAELVLESWNRRGNVRHLYVSDVHRRRGVGTALLGALQEAAKAAGARCLWIETQNVNHPAIQFYRRAGFRLAGLDRSLYDPASNPGEIALFFSRDL